GFELIVMPDMHHRLAGDWRPHSRSETALGEPARDRSLRVLGEEPVNLGDDFRVRLTGRPGRYRSRYRQRARGPASKPDVHDEVLAFNERHVLDDQSQDAFPFPVRCRPVAPEPWHVRREREDTGPLVAGERRVLGLTPLPIALLRFSEEAQFVVPVRFE